MTSTHSGSDSLAEATPSDQAFDPQARFVDSKGFAYRNFAHRLIGKLDEEDQGNRLIARYLSEGRSEAFCRVFREGYDRKFAEVIAQGCNELGDEAHWAHEDAKLGGLQAVGRAINPDHLSPPSSVREDAHQKAHAAGYGPASYQHPIGYHEC